MPPPTSFAAARARLDASLGQHVSDFRLSCALGIAQSTVRALGTRRRPLSRVYALALAYVARVGVDAADELDDPAPADLARLVRDIVLTPTQTAIALGMHRSTLPRITRETQRHAATRRVHYLALLELSEIAGPDSPLAEWLST